MYALTGANGQLGRFVIQHLLTLVPADQIIATTRNPQALADLAAKGVVVRSADFSDPATLPAAFAGATRLLIISTDTVGQRVEQHRAAINAAVAAGISHITYTSCVDADANASHPIQHEHGLTEEALAASGVAWTALRNYFYAEVLKDLIGLMLVDGQMLIPDGQAKTAWITREDCARTAAFVLADKTALSGPVDVTGPEAFSYADLAQRLSSLIGRTVPTRVVADEELLAQVIAKGIPEQVANLLVGIVIWTARVELAPVSDIVEQATGTKATSVDGVLRSLAVSA